MHTAFLSTRTNVGAVADEFGAEGRARKRFQRTIADEFNVLGASPKTQIDTDRRRSTLRENKAPLGPRPLGYSPSKRITSDATQRFPGPGRTFLLNSASESFIGSNSQENSRPFSYVGTPTEGHANDLLPTVNFDDFHASITSDRPELHEFPQSERFLRGGMARIPDSRRNVPGAVMPEEAAARRASILKRRSTAGGQDTGAFGSSTIPAASAAASAVMTPPSAPLSLRSRRQSQFPTTVASQAAVRPPTKSMAPGILRGDAQRDSSQAKSGVMDSSHTVKPKSVHQAQQQSQNAARLDPSATPDHPSARSSIDERSPGKMHDRRIHTPSSSGRRQSFHSHVSGLGARTISPTDAWRLKRLSMLHGDPSQVPVTSATPLPDSRPTTGTEASPLLIQRKTSTPSSARATPDHSRRFYGSGLSMSATSSHNSLKAAAQSHQGRSGSGLSASKLPTLNPRIVHSRGGGDEKEEVPPVPAIPKAYGSPNETDQQMLPSYKPTTPLNRMLNSSLAESTSALDRVGGRKETGHRRVLTVGAGPGSEKLPAPQNFARKPVQPMRLPPLNLGPLNTPTASRIASFPEPSAEVDRPRVTPPPMRSYAKTPGTPMTASKATFYNRHMELAEQTDASHIRRSSYHDFHSGNLKMEAFADKGMPRINGKVDNSIVHHLVSPFVSTSAPQYPDDSALHRATTSSGTTSDGFTPEFQSAKSNASVQNGISKSRKGSSSAHTSLSTEPETPSSGSSFRDKLHFGWKRASSKSPHRSQKLDEEQPPQPLKYSDMPPPKLPASATWTGPIISNATPAGRSRPQLDVSRRKSIASALTDEAQLAKANTWNATSGDDTTPNGKPAINSHTVARSASSSILTPMHKMMRSRSSFRSLRSRLSDGNVDKDVAAANEEMKMLASKRKDVENAAKELDELRKRAHPKERVSAGQALQMANLNIFERGEIIDFPDIYFCGTRTAKKHVGDLNAQSTNFGYDDDRGDYNIVLGDHLAYRYEVIDVLGKGSFGQVVRCVDHKTGLLVAIKIIRNKKRFHQQALVEVNILEKLRKWDPHNKHSMVNFTKSFYFRSHLCIATELLDMNLYEFIKAHEFRGFSLKLIRIFTRQMLSALILLKTHSVIHCDLKPENILLAHPLRSEIKVIDFGSSCFENEQVYTYIQSRFYRSPEVILGLSYGLPIDMWSLGCILAELLTGYPIFPGENEQEQLACIMEIFGPPERHLIEKSSRRKLFFDSNGKPRVTVSSKGRRRRPSSKTLQQALKCDDEAFLDFITRCLRWDPDRRLKPEEAIAHDFTTGVKKNSRGRPQAGAVNAGSSPVKRINTVQTPAKTRPLPEAPNTTSRYVAPVPRRDPSNSSPIKGGGVRRHSTINNLTSSIGVKRTSNGAAVSTVSTPKMNQRTVSAKPDLASAAAIASVKMRS